MRLLVFCLLAAAACSTASAPAAPNIVCMGSGAACSCSVDQSAIQAGSGHCAPSDVGGGAALCCGSASWPNQGSCLCTAASMMSTCDSPNVTVAKCE